jgi:peptidyl-prolyl cis-trans isomerase B (cyclophilin B)
LAHSFKAIRKLRKSFVNSLGNLKTQEVELTLTKSTIGKSSERERLARFAAKQDLEASKAVRRKKDNRLSVLVSGLAIVMAVGSSVAYSALAPEPEALTPEIAPTQPSAPIPDASIAEDRTWIGSIEVGAASLEIELDGELAPQAVASFIDLAGKGFFSGITCHRLTTTGIFVLQCGQSAVTSDGGPGYTFGPIENAPADNFYPRGTLAMARVGASVIGAEAAATSMGSQFFIVYEDSTISSDEAGGYTVFGKITGGLEDLQSVIDAGVLDGGVDGTPALETQLGAIELR